MENGNKHQDSVIIDLAAFVANQVRVKNSNEEDILNLFKKCYFTIFSHNKQPDAQSVLALMEYIYNRKIQQTLNEDDFLALYSRCYEAFIEQQAS